MPSPADDGTFLEHIPPSSSSVDGDGGGGEVTLVSSTPSTPVLAPSLTPASQPTISLLTDNNADALSVESLTLLPPADSPHLHPCSGYVPVSHSLQRPDASIAEEDEKEEDDKGERRDEELQEEDSLTVDETETDATVKEENTTMELITPTEDGPDMAEGGNELEVKQPEGLEVDGHLASGADVQEGDNLTASESVETEDAEKHTGVTLDSPELD